MKIELKSGRDMIAAERHRQVTALCYDADHDRRHGENATSELAYSAIAYWTNDRSMWSWDIASFKPRGRMENLVRAGALFQAAYDLEPREYFAQQRDLIADEIDAMISEFLILQSRNFDDASPRRWDEDPIVLNFGWLKGRCQSCGEKLPIAKPEPGPTPVEPSCEKS